MITLSAEFIRALSGLSAAELSDDTIDTLQVILIAEESALNYPELTEMEDLYYKGYKAITLLGPSLLLSIAQTIKDNFNQFTRFDTVQELIGWAAAKVAEVEDPEGFDNYNLFEVVVPLTDPVTQETT